MKLTNTQAEYITKYHDIVLKFMEVRGLNDDWYDVLSDELIEVVIENTGKIPTINFPKVIEERLCKVFKRELEQIECRGYGDDVILIDRNQLLQGLKSDKVNVCRETGSLFNANRVNKSTLPKEDYEDNSFEDAAVSSLVKAIFF